MNSFHLEHDSRSQMLSKCWCGAFLHPPSTSNSNVGPSHIIKVPMGQIGGSAADAILFMSGSHLPHSLTLTLFQKRKSSAFER